MTVGNYTKESRWDEENIGGLVLAQFQFIIGVIPKGDVLQPREGSPIDSAQWEIPSISSQGRLFVPPEERLHSG